MKIKLLLDAHIFDHSFQGTATYIQGLYNTLVNDEAFEIHICAHDIENLNSLFPDKRFYFIKLQSVSRIKRLLFEYPKIIKEGNFDYAHFQYIVPFIKNCKFITTVHDLLFLSNKQYFPWSYRVSRKILFFISVKRSEVILTVSDYSRTDIAKRFNISKSKIYVTPNAVSINDISPIRIDQKYGITKYILYVSRFEPRKNHIGLLMAFIELGLSSEGYSLVFIGSKKEQIEIEAYNRLLKKIKENNVENVHFLEKLSWPVLNAFYQQTECFVFPSLAEGFGIPPIEAAVNGSKVLCSNLTAMSEFNFFKYLFDPNDQGEFSRQLRAILDDNEYPYKSIKKEISSKYNWVTIADRFSKIIKHKI